MMEKANRILDAIDEVEALSSLVIARQDLRSVFEAVTEMFNATRNPLFKDYLDVIAEAGQSINLEIQMWAARQITLHASARYEDVPDASKGETK